NAPASVTNTVTVAGGGEANTANDQANDSTNINSLETVSTPIVPSGVSTGLTGTSYAFYASGAVSSLSHQLQYQFTWGDGTNSGWLPAGVTRTSHTWTTPGTYSVTTQARCAQDTSITSSVSTAASMVISAPAETISIPSAPSGALTGDPGTSYSYT